METEAFGVIYEAQATRLLRIAVLVGGERDAEDVVAETFARCWRRWQRHEPDDPGAYLRRTLLNELARRGARKTPVAGVARSPGLDEIADRLDLMRALGELDHDQRVVVVLRYLDDQSEAAVAELLEVPVGTVKSRASRGLARLQQILQPLDVTEAIHE